jgi:hypothetical protein
VVVGKSAKGANFCMDHKETAMVAETPEDAAQALIELENAELRDRLAQNAYDYIQRYFPSGEPQQFWQGLKQRYGLGPLEPVESVAESIESESIAKAV